MWLVLCSPSDVSARWAAEGLRRRGLTPLELVTSDKLAFARWEHRVVNGGTSLWFTLSEGRSIQAGDVRGALNRLQDVPPEALILIHPADRDYVRQEFYSFLMSCLGTLPGLMLNRPTAWGLSGRWRHLSEWVHLAARSGLPIAPYRESTLDLNHTLETDGRVVTGDIPVSTVFVVDGVVVGPPVPEPIRDGCRRLAELAAMQLLAIEFFAGPSGPWTFAGAAAQPDLMRGGEALLDAMAERLRAGSEAGR